MINRIKEYLEYRKNIKIAKREIVKIGAMVLPTVREVSNKGTDIVKFIMKLTNETKNINGEKLAEIVLHELSYIYGKFATRRHSENFSAFCS